jgi:hypothetical protein
MNIKHQQRNKELQEENGNVKALSKCSGKTETFDDNKGNFVPQFSDVKYDGVDDFRTADDDSTM